MNRKTIFGHMGQTLRLDLREKRAWKEQWDLGQKLRVFAIGPAGFLLETLV